MPRSFTLLRSRKDKIGIGSSIICSYDLVEYFYTKLVDNFDVLIIDEAHYLKTITTKRTKAVLGKKGFIHHAKRIWALSGTPAPNNASELWPILYTFGAISQSYGEFLKEFCVGKQTTWGFQVTGTNHKAIPKLRSILDKVMLRRTLKDVALQLPPINFNELTVEAGIVDIDIESSFVQYVYPQNRKNELEEKLDRERQIIEMAIGKGVTSVDSMKILEGLANSISTLRRYVGLQKVQNIAEIINEELEIGAYEKIVIFAIHRDVIESLRKRLHKWKPVTYYGNTPQEKKQHNIDKFQNDPNCQVFIGNIQACGVAINLTAANQVLFAEMDWVPGNNMQAAKRCHRIGQEKPVFIRMVSLAESFDERVVSILKRKSKELLALFG